MFNCAVENGHRAKSAGVVQPTSSIPERIVVLRRLFDDELGARPNRLNMIKGDVI